MLTFNTQRSECDDCERKDLQRDEAMMLRQAGQIITSKVMPLGGEKGRREVSKYENREASRHQTFITYRELGIPSSDSS